MGNEFVKPSKKNILRPDLFVEYIDAKLSDVRESSDYLALKNVKFLNKREFDEAFSVLFKDPDDHFHIFERSAVESQISLAHREDSVQPYGTVNSFVVCTIISLLSKDSVDKKMAYLYDLHFNNDLEIEVNLKHLTDNVISGTLALFKVNKAPPKYLQYTAVISSLKAMRNSQRLQNEIDDVVSDEGVVSLHDFFQLCQESQAISKLLNAILQMSSNQQVVQAESAAVALETKLISTEANSSEKIRHPLWQFHIMDMFEESWLVALPQVANSRSISSCIEFMLYSGKKALPVYFNPNTDIFDATDASLITYDKKKKIVRVSEFDNPAVDSKEEDGFLSDSYQLQGIIDEYTIMLWLAECCPENVAQKHKVTRKAVVEIKGGRRRSSVASTGSLDRRTSSVVNNQTRSALMFAMPQMGGRARRTSFNSAVGSQWREVGMTFLGSSVNNILSKYAANPIARKGYKSQFKCVLVKNNELEREEARHAPDCDTSKKSRTRFRCEVSYCLHDIFQTDQFLYNVVEMIARGFRNVPLASSRVRPFVVSHVISSVDVACFLRLYSKECLGNLASNTVIESGLMKIPLVVSCDLGFGCAIQHLLTYKLDSAAIIDEKGRWVGRLDCSSAAVLWWRWKSVAKGVLGDKAELDKLRDEFLDERYDEFNIASVKNFSSFSMMMNPLRECSSLGINIYDFEAQFKDDTKSADTDDSTVSSQSISTSSSSSSDSDSDSSTSTSNDSDSDVESDTFDVDGKFGGVSKLSMSSVASKRVSNMAAMDKSVSLRDLERKAKLKHQRQFTNWLRKQGLVLEKDTIASCLEVMCTFKTTKAFVVNSFGEVIGVVSLRSIAIEILKNEYKIQRENYFVSLEEDKDDD